jgi:transcriptional regulator with GAF, ATPase, and Fis domain
VTVDVRIVAATGGDLRSEIRAGRFRQDLLYRLNVIPIHLPPLRDRREDIPLLVDHFLEKYNREANRKVTIVPRDVLDTLVAYSWPGNVRELENCIERAVSRARQYRLPELLPDDFDSRLNPGADPSPRETDAQADFRKAFCAFGFQESFGLRDLLDTVEKHSAPFLDSGRFSQRGLASMLLPRYPA